ncbi:Hypothetical predicted protein [Pelobates cultripes]|uniref:Uncharacterized protein n=1 Tax=Pelobates cultripes TaxID=61616 RepID=A0AAD1TLT9_PELCU|nr:Hypothetical predicted protein [Pelobates cultripes]
MDGFLQTPADAREEAGGSKMAAASQPHGDPPTSTLEGIGEELRTIAASMATKADLWSSPPRSRTHCGLKWRDSERRYPHRGVVSRT